jgi:hypothetical protein
MAASAAQAGTRTVVEVIRALGFGEFVGVG